MGFRCQGNTGIAKLRDGTVTEPGILIPPEVKENLVNGLQKQKAAPKSGSLDSLMALSLRKELPLQATAKSEQGGAEHQEGGGFRNRSITKFTVKAWLIQCGTILKDDRSAEFVKAKARCRCQCELDRVFNKGSMRFNSTVTGA